MENIKRITDLLLALKLLSHQTHLLSVSHADHLLAERIQDGLDENIDLLKEISLYYFDTKYIASCCDTLEGALDYVKDVNENISIDQSFSYILEIIDRICSMCGIAIESDSQRTGLATALGDVARDLSQKGYLVKQRLAK